MKILSRLAAAAAFCAALGATVHAQTILQSGPYTPGHAVMYAGASVGQAVAADAGGASGGPAGTGLTEPGLQAQGVGTPPFVASGTGPLGTNLCDYDAPTTNPGGYHYLCLSANAQGGGLIAYGAGGAALPLPLFFNVNGVQFQAGSGGSGGGAVTSIFGRTGIVTAQLGDYSFALLSGQASVNQLPSINANAVLANITNGTTVPSAAAVPGCTDTAGNHLNYTLGTGFSCGTTSSGGLLQINANSVLANTTGVSAVPVGNAVPGCADSGGNHLNYINGTGFTCGTTSSGGNVTSVFSRTGVVTAQSGDYSFSLLSGQAALVQLPTLGANTMLANTTAGSATPTAASLPSCPDSAGQHVNYTNGTGFSCGSTSSGGAGSISITAGNAGIVVSPSPITGIGTVATSFPSQTKAATYTFVVGDLAKFTWFNASSAVTANIPQAIGSFANGAALCIGNQGTGALTLAPATSTIYGIPSLVLSQNQSVCLISDGANWGAQLSGNLIKLTDNGSVVSAAENMDLTTLAIVTEIANAGSTGTTLSKLAKLTGAPSTAVVATTLDTAGMIGVTVGGAGTTGNAQIAITGQAACVFDGATTAGDYVQISATAAGDCHDAGSTFPTTGQVLGRVLSTNGATGTFAMVIFPPPGQGTGGGGGSGTVTSVTPGAGLVSGTSCVSGTNTAITTAGTLCTDAAYQPFYLAGLTLANDGVTPNSVIDVAAGVATSDDGTVIMKIAAVTKTTGAWAVGTGNGCVTSNAGTVQASTPYHVFLIERTDTGVVDVMCDASAASPTLPTSYTKKRRLGSFFTCDTAICAAANTNIAVFKQVGNVFYLGTAPLDVTTAALGTSAALQTLTHVPPGVKVQPLCRFSFSNAASTALLLTSPDESDVAPATSNPFTAAPGWDLDQPSTTATGGNGACPFLTTNTTQQIRARASNATTSLDIVTRGWAE